MSTARITAAQFSALTGTKAPRRVKAAKVKSAPLCDSFVVTTDIVNIRLPWPVSINNYYVRTRFGGVAIGKAGREYRTVASEEWSRQAGSVTFDGRIAVRLVCVFPDERERDLDNIEKCLFDALQHAGAFRRDSQVKLKTSEQEMVQRPGWVEVTIGPKPGVEVQRGLFGNQW